MRPLLAALPALALLPALVVPTVAACTVEVWHAEVETPFVYAHASNCPDPHAGPGGDGWHALLDHPAGHVAVRLDPDAPPHARVTVNGNTVTLP